MTNKNRLQAQVERILKQFTGTLEDFVSGVNTFEDGIDDGGGYADPHGGGDSRPPFVRKDDDNWSTEVKEK